MMRYLFLSVLVALTFAGSDGKCRALVLSGGGDKGAYQAAVIDELMKALPKIETAYDTVIGISAGNLNAALLATFDPEDQENFQLLVNHIWSQVSTGDVVKMWPGGLLQGLTIAPSLFSNKALKKTLEQVLEGRSIRRKFTAGTTDANAAQFVTYSYEPQEGIPDDFIETCLASAAIPGFFPYIKRDDKVLIDGGMIWSWDIPSAVDNCREMGYADADIIIDTVVLSVIHELTEKDMEGKKSLGYYQRAHDTHSFYNTMSGLELNLAFFPDVNFRYFIGPSENLSPIPMNFKRDHLDRIIALGREDAKKALELGEHGYRDLLRRYHEELENGNSVSFKSWL